VICGVIDEAVQATVIGSVFQAVQD